MKRILVTGSEGYIGINLQKFLLEKGFEIVPLDRRIGLYAEDYKDFVKDKIDAIVHLAGDSGIQTCEIAPQEAIRNNFWSSCNMFEGALIHKIPCVFTSSQAAKNMMSSMYAFTKYSSEVAANIFLDKGADIKILRLSNVYGGIGYLRKKNSVVAKFSREYIKGNDLIVNGDGSQIRDFIHVSDVCYAILLSLKSSIVDIPLDIGTGRGISILELATMFDTPFTFNQNSDTIGLESSVAQTEDAKKYISFEAMYRIEDYIENIKRFKDVSWHEIVKMNL